MLQVSFHPLKLQVMVKMTELQLKDLINKHVDSLCIMTFIQTFSSISNEISSNYIMSYSMGQDVNLPLPLLSLWICSNSANTYSYFIWREVMFTIYTENRREHQVFCSDSKLLQQEIVISFLPLKKQILEEKYYACFWYYHVYKLIY